MLKIRVLTQARTPGAEAADQSHRLSSCWRLRLFRAFQAASIVFSGVDSLSLSTYTPARDGRFLARPLSLNRGADREADLSAVAF
jgi:hypothetical protein